MHEQRYFESSFWFPSGLRNILERTDNNSPLNQIRGNCEGSILIGSCFVLLTKTSLQGLRILYTLAICVQPHLELGSRNWQDKRPKQIKMAGRQAHAAFSVHKSIFFLNIQLAVIKPYSQFQAKPIRVTLKPGQWLQANKLAVSQPNLCQNVVS